MKIVIITLILLFFFFQLVTSAKAVENGSIAIYPTNYNQNDPVSRAWFQISLNPNEKYASEVTVFNKTNQEKSITLYGVDATTTSDGVFSLKQKNENTDMGEWIHTDLSTVIIPPQEKVTVPFSIIVPANATPGDHTAGIVAQESTQSAVENLNGVNIVSRVGVRVYARISGKEVEQLQFGNLNVDNLMTPDVISLPINNQGNTNQKVESTFAVLGISGYKSIKSENEAYALPGKDITVLGKTDVLVPLVLSAKVHYGKNGQYTQNMINLTPSSYILIAFIVIFAISLVILRKKHTRTHNIHHS